MSRTYRVQDRLQNACDAGVLAGRKAVNTDGYDSTAIAQATKFFNINFDATQQGVPSVTFNSSSSDQGVTVVGSASTSVPMLLMELFGKTAITVTATCTSTEGIGNADVTFVLDTTGSMADTISTGTTTTSHGKTTTTTTTKIAALQAAMESFYTTLASATAGTSARVRYAFVPYSSTVNVGKLIYGLSPSYIVDTWGYQSRVARFETTTNIVFSNTTTSVIQSSTAYYSTPNSTPTSYSGSYTGLPACLAAMPADTAWTNNGSATTANGTKTTISSGSGRNATSTSVTPKVSTQPQIMTSYTCVRSGDVYYVYSYKAYQYLYTYTYTGYSSGTATTTTTFDHFDYKMVKYDVSAFKTGATVTTQTGTNGANQSFAWDGCIEERNTVSDAAFDYSSTLGKIEPTGALDLDIDSAPTSDDKTKWAPLGPLVSYYRSASSNLATTGGYYGEYCPTAATTLAEMSQSAFNTYATSLTAVGATYHDIGMLWGARISSTTGMFSSIVNQAPTNGQTVSRHLIFMTDGTPEANEGLEQAYGVEYNDKRITDDGSTSDDDRHEARFRAICDAIKAKGIRIWVIGFTTALTSDLSYCASDNSSYTASTSNDLNTAFQTIANNIGELRINQ